MAIDDMPGPEGSSTPFHSESGSKFAIVFVALVALALGEVYSLSKLSSLSGTVETQQAKLQKELATRLQQDISDRLSAFETSNAQQFEKLRADITRTQKHQGSARGDFRRTKELVTKLETEQKQQADQLKMELAQKADQQQVGALTQDVSATRTDLDNTKKALEATRSDLGMARSELGTLIARNHDEIEQLRKMGERDYLEFTLNRKHPQRVGGVGLALTRTNPKRHRFSLSLTVDEMDIEKKDRTINEPIFFSVSGSKKFYELVINKVESNQVKGYLSAPKGAVETATAARSS